MSTAVSRQQNQAVASSQQQGGSAKTMEYIPFGESNPIILSIPICRAYVCHPTKRGFDPPDAEVFKFMVLCRSGKLNPFTGDCWLVGYDSNDGPTFTMITSVAAIMKRAEWHPKYKGCESGLIVVRGQDALEIEGECPIPGDRVVGSWCRVYRSDRDVPITSKLEIGAYDQGRSLWKDKKNTMIVKCAIAASHRKAFPTAMHGMYCQEEMEAGTIDSVAVKRDAIQQPTKSERIAASLGHVTDKPEKFSPQSQEVFVPESSAVPIRNTVPVQSEDHNRYGSLPFDEVNTDASVKVEHVATQEEVTSKHSVGWGAVSAYLAKAESVEDVMKYDSLVNGEANIMSLTDEERSSVGKLFDDAVARIKKAKKGV
ncbi:phage recombination protein Bet [Candidatus Kaiserbacteria bacterium]|nr:phage recombination protein Bet [Candidatus Kaiserbacteria bacterium]